MSTEARTSQKIRNAEETLERAQSALDKAQSGLHTAEEVAVTVESARPGRWILIALAAILTIGVIVYLLRDREE